MFGYWCMMMVAAGGKALNFLGAYVDNSNLTTYTFSLVPLGAPSNTRRIFVGVCGYTNSGDTRFSSCTINGVTATLHVSAGNTGSWVPTGIYSALVPSGSSGNIVVTFNTGTANCQIAVWESQELADASPTATATAENAQTPNLSLNTPDNGLVISYTAWSIAASAVTWVGETEQFDAATGEGSIRHSGASEFPVTAAFPRTVNVTYSQTNNNGERAVALSWK